MIPYRTIKRGLDVVGSATALIVTSPLIGITAVLVRKNLGSPVLFVQERPGRDGKIFRLYKFRSMKDVDHQAALVSDQDRLTEFGRRLRSTSLDELPSLVNVLKGEMSFVGPRPLLVAYLERYSSEQKRRHQVRPGITGLAQVNGRNLLGWHERFDLDIQYVENLSFILDCKILTKTIATVFKRHGINSANAATMTEFSGDQVH